MKNDPKHIKIGKIGEELACLFLVKRGFKITERHYLKKWGEIDIIAQKNKVLRFVEVKCVSCETGNGVVSRETGYQGLTSMIRPEEHVTREKLERLSRAIQTYLVEKHISRETRYQVDVVAIRLNLKDKTAHTLFIENVL
ncbi:MAG: YraN family protein [Candidatus Campbellbacteria bacterium]|nr:YraN family protein [Candidatus Campbellbacteria bacterium]